jgi:hypothetical protein
MTDREGGREGAGERGRGRGERVRESTCVSNCFTLIQPVLPWTPCVTGLTVNLLRLISTSYSSSLPGSMNLTFCGRGVVFVLGFMGEGCEVGGVEWDGMVGRQVSRREMRKRLPERYPGKGACARDYGTGRPIGNGNKCYTLAKVPTGPRNKAATSSGVDLPSSVRTAFTSVMIVPRSSSAPAAGELSTMSTILTRCV